MSNVAGIPFACTTLPDAVERVLDTARGKYPPTDFRLANAYCVALANMTEDYGSLLRDRGCNFPDGQPVALVLKAESRSVHPQRVRGPSLFEMSLKESAADARIRHFFVGSTPETLKALLSEVRRSYPEINIAGSFSPPFAPLSRTYLNDLVERIRPYAPDIVWVGMGTPKQDFVSAAIVDELGVSAAGVGAAFDFLAGTVKQAPAWIQKCGAEWLYRLLQEPRRLWKRYLVGNSQFVFYVVRYRLRPTRKRESR